MGGREGGREHEGRAKLPVTKAKSKARQSGPTDQFTHDTLPPQQVRFLMALFYPVAKPVALLLDALLGQELRTVYGREELVKMLEIHVRQGALDAEVSGWVGGWMDGWWDGWDGWVGGMDGWVGGWLEGWLVDWLVGH